MAKKNQGAIPQANVPHIAVPRDCEKESVSSSQSSTGSSQNSTEESSSSFPATTGSSQNSTEESMSSFPATTDSSRNSTEKSSSSFATTTDSSENTSKESMLKKHDILEAQDSITTMNKIQEMRSPKTSTSSEHHKNMKKYYKKKENQIKLKLRLEKYMVEMKLLEMKIKDLSTYLDICVCENKEDCKDNH